MAPTFTLLGAVLGAVIAGVIAWLNSRRQTRKDQYLADVARNDAAGRALTERVTAYLAATYHGVLSLRDLALADAGDKARLEKNEVWPTVDRVNAALTAIEVNEPDNIVAAVRAVDQAMITLARVAKERTFEHDEWRAERDQVLATLPDVVVDLVRAEVVRLRAGG